MVFQTDLRPAFVDPIPGGRAPIQRMMLATSALIDGVVDKTPERFQAYLANTYLMPDARLLIGGTLCRRPLVLREFAAVCSVPELDGILVRADEDHGSTATFDIKPAHDDRMLCAYRLWMREPSGAAWLVPSAGADPFVRLDPLGLEIGDDAPFTCEIDRARGLKHGTRFMAVADKGWF
jgi:hypothetical protein